MPVRSAPVRVGCRRLATGVLAWLVVSALRAGSASAADGGPVAAVVARAQWLLQQGEAFRAAGVLLDAEYDVRDDAARRTLRWELARVYLAAGQPDRAADAWSKLGGAARPAGEREPHRLGAALIALRRGDLAGAHALLAAPPTPPWAWLHGWLAALVAVQGHQWDAARHDVAIAVEACAMGNDRCPSAVTPRLRRLHLVLAAGDPARRSPALATALSAALPGAGFVYVGHGFDAVLHGGATLLGGWLTWDTRTRGADLFDQRPGTWVLGALTALFYTANVLASHDAAQRRTEVEAWRFAQDSLLGAWPDLPPLTDAVPLAAPATTTLSDAPVPGR